MRYLVVIGADLLPALYGEVLIPETVASELQQPQTPEPVRRWMVQPPAWLQVLSLDELPALTLVADLDLGEYDAIRLAIHRNADLVLMDEREGVEEARRLGLTVTGTIGILDRAAERNLVDLPTAFTRLRQLISESIPLYWTVFWPLTQSGGSLFKSTEVPRHCGVGTRSQRLLKFLFQL